MTSRNWLPWLWIPNVIGGVASLNPKVFSQKWPDQLEREINLRNYSSKVLRTKNSLPCYGVAEEKKKGLTEINLEHLIGEQVMMYTLSLDLFHVLNKHSLKESLLYWQGACISGDRNDDGEKDIFVANYYTMQCDICCTRARDKNLLTVLYSMILMGLI